MAAEYRFVLADPTGNDLAELTTAAGKAGRYKRNWYSEWAMTISHEDDAAYEFFNCLKYTGIPTLKAWRKAGGASAFTLVFHGWMAPFTEELEESCALNLVFRSPFARTLGEGENRGRFTDAFIATDGAFDAGRIGHALAVGAEGGVVFNPDPVNTNQSGTRLSQGNREITKDRVRTYEYANRGEAVVNLTNVLDGFDFAERFVADEDPMAYLDIYATMGSDRPGVKFEYGEGTLANVRAIHRETHPPINVARVIGNGVVGEVTDSASILKYGAWWVQYQASDVTEQATVDDKAYALLRPNPIRTVSFVPDPRLAPVPWDDYWLGDTVRVYGNRGAFTEEATVRVNEIGVVVDENGVEAAEIADPSDPALDAKMRAFLATEEVDPVG